MRAIRTVAQPQRRLHIITGRLINYTERWTTPYSRASVRAHVHKRNTRHATTLVRHSRPAEVDFGIYERYLRSQFLESVSRALISKTRITLTALSYIIETRARACATSRRYIFVHFRRSVILPISLLPPRPSLLYVRNFPSPLPPSRRFR